MRALIQRINKGSVTVDQRIVADEIGFGLMIFLGVGHEKLLIYGFLEMRMEK